jgi:hypothetical protein
VVAAIYFDDMYVPRELSLDTAARIRGLRYWITNEFEHDGLRTSEGRFLDRLIGLARDTVAGMTEPVLPAVRLAR